MASTTVQSAAYRWRPGCCAEGPAGDGGLRRGMRRPRRSSEARTPYGRTYLGTAERSWALRLEPVPYGFQVPVDLPVRRKTFILRMLLLDPNP
jgi:hypothetical protein